MHRKSRAPFLLLHVFVFAEWRFFAENPYVAGTNSDYPRGCDQLTCKIGEQCVNRKFWCNHSPCPSMTYCSKSRKESLKGPESCDSVICTTGYKCVVRVRDCEWNEDCKQRAARCVSNQELEESPASCTTVACPTGHRCVLRETHCHRPPCKLTRTCAQNEAVHTWFEKCKQMGCRSEHDCFLRRPPEKCAAPPCHHVPDCAPLTYSGDDEQSDTSVQYCHGWICPVKQVCSARVEATCKQRDNCRVTRSCQPPSLILTTNTSRDSQQPIDVLSPRTTLTDLEREAFLAEQHRLRNYLRSTSTSNFTKFMMRPAFDGISLSSSSNSGAQSENPATVKTKRVTEVPGSMRAASSLVGDSPWLTYLKRKAGAEAVQYWIEKARNNEDYEEFVEWLESVSGLLDADTYRLWLRELELATLDVPEFQSWISPRNLAAHRSHRPDSAAAAAAVAAGRSFHADTGALGTFPGSIGGQAKNHLDNSFVFFESNGNPGQSVNHYPATFMEKQTESSGVGPLPAHLHESSSSPHGQSPSNFNFNEPRQFDGLRRVLPSRPPTPLPYLEIGNRRLDRRIAAAVITSVQAHYVIGHPSRVNLSLNSQPPPSQEYIGSDGIEKPWNSWQSYYQLDPPSALRARFPSQLPYTTMYLGNYTVPRENFDIQQQQLLQRPRQPQIFFPNDQNPGRRKAIVKSDQGSPAGRRYETMQLKRIKLDDDVFGGLGSGGELPRDNLASMRSVIDKLSGFNQLNQLKPNVRNLDPRHSGPLHMFPDIGIPQELPNLLIYFPPPFNFFIYYSGKDTDDSSIIEPVQEPQEHEKHENDKSPYKKPCNSSDNYQDSGTRQQYDSQSTRRNDENCHHKLKKLNKHKELDYIRKIIIELLDYWDNEEKTLEHADDPHEDSKLSDSKPPAKDDKPSLTPPFDSFMEWLKKNAKRYHDFLIEKSQKKEPSYEDKSDEYEKLYKESSRRAFNPHSMIENSRKTVPKKIRVLVDVDKNPEVMKALLSRPKVNNTTDTNSHEYQVIVNLKDLVDPKDEDVISRRLMNIATNQLHKNLTNDKRMPKTLWVFPIYEDEENDTVINEIEKMKSEQINTLEDVNLPITSIYNYDKYRPKIPTRTDNNVPQFITRHRMENNTQPYYPKGEYNEFNHAEDEDGANENGEDYEDEDPDDETHDQSHVEKKDAN